MNAAYLPNLIWQIMILYLLTGFMAGLTVDAIGNRGLFAFIFRPIKFWFADIA